ncbi:PapB family radical SAM/SPASM ranthipeptide maturase [Vallitalea guaymasensis]|uniref:PapB family radical SAM/SPASM ranthipeptide maturase n=1 Tax=Vallitalea guaymasensis TaxID=1185412 RepID=UPI002356F9FE|nr:radical SAM protein [Vallitalea guaymasensis]
MVKDTKISFYPHEIINEGDKFYYYNAVTSSLYEMDEVTIKILNNDIDDIIDSAYEDNMNFMKQNFIVRTEENEVTLDEIYNKVAVSSLIFNPNQLILMVSQECNLRCSYCYGGDGEYNLRGKMKYEVAKKAVDYFVSHSKKDKLNICFFGGEPLLNFDLIKKIVAYTKELENELNREFTFSMTTNGTVINKEIERFIIEHDFSVTISIDGDSTAHNSNRFYGNKKGCYDDVIKNTAGLREMDKLSARATLTSNNTNVFNILDHLIDLGFNKVTWSPAMNMMTKKDMGELIDSQKKVISKVGELINAGNVEEAKKYSQIIKLFKKIHKDGIRLKACGTGTNMIAVGIEGDIYPCHRFVGISPIKIGNIFNDTPCSNPQFYKSIDVREMEECHNCISRNICLGGCPQVTYEANHNKNIPKETLCDYNRETLIQIIRTYINIDKEVLKKCWGNK